MTQIDVEVTVPGVVSKSAEESIASAVRLIQAGANPETVLRTMYLFGFMDGGLEIVK